MADDFSEKLNAVLSNPDAMGQIMSIARSLTGEGGGSPEESAPPETALAPAGAQPSTAPLPDLSGLLGMLGGLTGGGGQGAASDPLSALSNLDPRLIQAGIRIFSEYGREDDRKVALLQALKPFLKAERAAKIDRAAQAAKIARVVRAALQMFKEGGGEDHV